MKDFFSRNADVALCLRLVKAIARMRRQNPIGRDLVAFVHLDAHANMSAIFQNFVFLFVNQIRLKHLKRKPVLIILAPHLADKALTIARHCFDDIALNIKPGHLAIDGAVAQPPPFLPSVFDNRIARLVQRPV